MPKRAASSSRSAAPGRSSEQASPEKGPKKAPRKKAARPSARQAPTGRRPGQRHTPSDLLSLLVLGLMASLAACTLKKPPHSAPTGTTDGGQLTIRFLDVGQGDAVLIRTPDDKTMLVDGGRSTNRMADLMQTYGIDRIDLMVATHADSDHITGLGEAARVKPKLFINNGLGGTTRTWDRLVSALQGAGTTFQKANNQTINLGSSVKVHVLAAPDGVPDTQNDHSVGIVLEFGSFRALMTGDSEKPETNAWLSHNRADVTGPFQVYKSIHHGAANGDHQAWLSVVRPENVVISVGPNNYGHPTQTALDLYKQNGVRIYRTDQQGTVTFTGEANGKYQVQTDR